MKELQIKQLTIGNGFPKICVPIVATNEEQLLSGLKDFDRPDIDLIEWRIDFMDCIHDTSKLLYLAEQIQETLPEKPLLITFRSKKEGGEQELSTYDYLQLNLAFARSGFADLIDLELFCSEDENELLTIVEEIHDTGTKIIFSNHDFQKTPSEEELIKRLTKMQTFGGDIAKIAVMPNSASDVLTLLSATRKMHEEIATIPIVTMSMGQLGIISRISGGTFGSAITFGALGQSSAPGQLAVSQLHSILHSLNESKEI